eukprot:754452-Hanusia_phi.AAC.27
MKSAAKVTKTSLPASLPLCLPPSLPCPFPSPAPPADFLSERSPSLHPGSAQSSSPCTGQTQGRPRGSSAQLELSMHRRRAGESTLRARRALSFVPLEFMRT